MSPAAREGFNLSRVQGRGLELGQACRGCFSQAELEMPEWRCCGGP